jgi:hypothetical protein
MEQNCKIKHYAMKTYAGEDVQIHVFLTSAIAAGQLHNPAALPPGKYSLIRIL